MVIYAQESPVRGHSGQLSINPYAWNRKAYVVYVDQPRYVGFSCGTGDYVTSSVDAGLDIVQFILGFKRTYPEHAERVDELRMDLVRRHANNRRASVLLGLVAVAPALRVAVVGGGGE